MRTGYILILLSLLLILPASAKPLAKIEIFNNSHYESLTVLKPGDDGNWIKMTGGSEVVIPNIKFVYNGINNTQYTKNNKTIKITTYGIQKNQDYVVDYPFTEHPVYYRGNTVSAEILGTSDLAGKTTYVYLVKTYPTQLKNALTSAIDGDTQPLRNLLNSAIQEISTTLNASGDANVSFGTLGPGDYVVAVLLNRSTDLNITFVSATAFEVLEYKSSLNVSNITRSSVNDNVFLDGTFTIIGGSNSAKYTYIVALIRKEAYSVEFRLESGGTKATTNLKANNATLVKSFKIGGVGLNKVNATTVYNWIKDAFPPNSVSVEKGKKIGNTYEFSLPVSGLPDGEYYLSVAAWNSSNSSQKVVAFSQAIVKITTITTFGVSPTSISKTITRGSSASVRLIISNTGNYELRELRLSASGNIAGWISFSQNYISSIPAGESKAVTVRMSVPNGAGTGTHTGKITLTSENGGSKEIPVSINVRAVVTGGGGGGGYVAPPPAQPARPTHVKAAYSEALTVPANVETKIELPPAKAKATGVLAVVIKVPEKMMLEVQVSKLKSLPSGVPKPPAKDVYEMLDIAFSKYGTGIKVEPSGYIEFKVSKSWIEKKSYDPAEIVLMEYHKGWEELKTEMTGEDMNYYYYKAEAGSFSIFAIAVKAVTPVVTPTPISTTTPVTAPTVTPTVTPTPTPKPWWRIPGFETALAIAALAIIVLWRRKME